MNKLIEWIKTERSKGRSWEELRYAKRKNEAELLSFLNFASEDMHWPELTVDNWYKFVEQQRKEEENLEKLIDTKGATVIHATNEQNLIEISSNEDSAWQCYKRLLLREKGFKNEVVNVNFHASAGFTSKSEERGIGCLSQAHSYLRGKRQWV